MTNLKTPVPAQSKMKVEVWSDIMCPFCYIGKRNYESALKQFEDRDRVEIEWHSFQLDPTIPKKIELKENVYQYLAKNKGIPYEQSIKMHERVMDMANEAGLDYRFDKAIVANSFDTHRLIQLAKTKGLGDEAEEKLFHAYFTEGRDLGDHETLIAIGKEIGLKKEEIRDALTSEEFAAKVEKDINEAGEIGIRGVPFFVLDRKYAVSGAQPPAYFLQALKQSFGEWKENNPLTDVSGSEDMICTPDGECN